MKFLTLKKGQKVVDRWYSFSHNSFDISGVGVITKISKKNKTVQIKFNNNKVHTYDKDHVEHFIAKYTRGMSKQYQGKVIPF